MSTERKTRSYEIDMLNGPLLPKIIAFSVPLMLSGVLQLLFNAADIVVVGRYVGHSALAAVGSTGALINLLVNVFIGLSIGANVLVARHFGAGHDHLVSDVVHTAILAALVSGTVLVVVGVLLSKPLLTLMGTPDDVLSQAALYMSIYFVGMPVMMVYNFGAAILRAVGDTKRPLYYLTSAGVINVLLNLFFICVVGMGVEGVALATIISQAVSACLIIRCLLHSEASYRLVPSKLHINKNVLKQMLRIGLPAGFQGALFSLSNAVIQSSINSFGSVAMAGSTAAANIEGFIYTAMNAFHQSNVSFTSQNLGAGHYKRIRQSLYICIGSVTVVGIALGFLVLTFARPLLGIYAPGQPEVIEYGLLRMQIISSTYFFCGIMEVLVGSLRGMGYAIMPMIVSLTGACGLRILWIYTVFASHRGLRTLYISYPVSWIITASIHAICFVVVYRRLLARVNKAAR